MRPLIMYFMPLGPPFQSLRYLTNSLFAEPLRFRATQTTPLVKVHPRSRNYRERPASVLALENVGSAQQEPRLPRGTSLSVMKELCFEILHLIPQATNLNRISKAVMRRCLKGECLLLEAFKPLLFRNDEWRLLLLFFTHC